MAERLHLSIGDGWGVLDQNAVRERRRNDFQRHAPVCLTAIDDVATRADLLDRSLIVPLPAIPDANRRTEKQIDAAFALAQPLILARTSGRRIGGAAQPC